MVLSSLNSGKYLSGRRQREREKALKDRTGYTPSQLSYLDISGSQGGGKFNPINFEIETQPIMLQTPVFAGARKIVDIRTDDIVITGD